MAAEKLFNKPSNKIVQGDYLGPMAAQIGDNATAAYMVPGRAVCFDTSDNCVKEATDPSGNVVGILGYEDTPAFNQPTAGITGAYAVGDKVAVHMTIGMYFKGWLANGQTSYPGIRLKLTSAGTFTAAGANETCNAKAIESVTASGTTACWMQWLG